MRKLKLRAIRVANVDGKDVWVLTGLTPCERAILDAYGVLPEARQRAFHALLVGLRTGVLSGADVDAMTHSGDPFGALTVWCESTTTEQRAAMEREWAVVAAETARLTA